MNDARAIRHPLSLRIAGGVVCGALALALNHVMVPMLSPPSPAFAFGGVLVLFAFWQLGLVAGLVAAALGFALGDWGREMMFVLIALYAAEGFVVSRLARRTRSLVVADVLFWLTAGALLDVLFYRWLMGLGSAFVLIMLLKQLLNGVMNAVLADGLARLPAVRRLLGAAGPAPRDFYDVLFDRTVPLVMVPVTIIVLLLARASYAAQYNRIAADLRESASNAGAGAERFFQSRISTLESLARTLPHDRRDSRGTEAAALRAFHAVHPEFYNIFIADASGRVVVASPATSTDGSSNIGRDLAARPYFGEARMSRKVVVGELVLGQLHLRRPGVEPVLPVAVPLLAPGGNFDGVIMGALDVMALPAILGAQARRDAGAVQLVDRASRVVASTDRATPVGTQRARELPGLFARDAHYPAAVASRGLETFTDRLGINPSLVVSQVLSAFPFAVLVDAPLSLIFREISTTSLGLILLMLVALLAVYAVARSLGTQLAAPLTAIGAVAQDIAEGENVPRGVLADFEASPVREIQSMATQLGVMDRALRERRDADATRVQQSERKYRETLEQLAQAQKMEGIGRLAGGIAHDFNNLLTPILGYTDLAISTVPEGSPTRRDLALVRTAAGRAKEVVAQLLAFGRAQVLDVNRIDLAETVAEFEPLLRRTLRESIDLSVTAEPGIVVEADQAKVQQVLMNLVINAVDAMPNEGRVEVRVALEEVTDLGAPGPEPLLPGTYGVIIVSDTGVGMDDETRQRAFDPFFTTKPRGKGTGLGLSVAYGIARQHRGTIRVSSAPGLGTSMHVLLPLAPPQSLPKPDAAILPDVSVGAGPSAGATLMVVEDESAVRELVRAALSRAGYRILAARDGEEALTRAAAHEGRIDLLLTDVVMPGLNGPELARQFRRVRPEARVLFMSGYAADHIADEGMLSGDADLLAKPFAPDELVVRVRTALDRSG
ncbi:MAG: ATP-binding protein [Gemmatimonadaceae bacterium]